MMDSRGERNSNNKQQLNQMQMDAMVAQVMSALQPQFESIRTGLKRIVSERPRRSHDHPASERCYSKSSRFHSSRERRNDREEKQLRSSDRLDRLKLEIPEFEGSADPEEYLEWEEKIELVFSYRDYTQAQKIMLASSEFKGHALSWWDNIVASKGRLGDFSIDSWNEMKTLMRWRFVPSRYYRRKRAQEGREHQQGNLEHQRGSKEPTGRDKQRSVEKPKPLQKKSSGEKLYEETRKEMLEIPHSMEITQKKSPANRPSIDATTRPMVIEEAAENNIVVETQQPARVQDQQSLCSQEEQIETMKQLTFFSTPLEAKCDLPLFQSDSVQLTHLEPVQPSCSVSVSQVLEETSQEDSPAGTQRSFSIEQPTHLVPQPALI